MSVPSGTERGRTLNGKLLPSVKIVAILTERSALDELLNQIPEIAELHTATSAGEGRKLIETFRPDIAVVELGGFDSGCFPLLTAIGHSY